MAETTPGCACFFRLLNVVRTPDPVYYWFLDRLTDNNGWRPLSYRERRREGRSR